MLISRSIVSICFLGMSILSAPAVFGQAYPNKPIHIICSGPTQGFIARLIADGITGPLGQPVIVEDRPNVPISSETVAKARPDGYTVLLAGSNFYVSPLTQKLNYDPVKDFAPLTIVGRAPLVVYVHPSLPVKSVKELIAYAKARPGQVHTSLGGLGGGGHISVELFNTMADIKIVPVPYSSGSQEVADLISGRIPMTISPVNPFMEHVKAGKLRALAVTSLAPSPMAPDLPPIAATLPGYEFINMTTMAAPANTPASVVARLNEEIVRVLNSSEAKERLLNTGGLEVVASTPAQFASILEAETAKLKAVVKTMALELK